MSNYSRRDPFAREAEPEAGHRARMESSQRLERERAARREAPVKPTIVVQRSYTNCPPDTDRSERVFIRAAGREFPSPDSFDFIDNPTDPGAVAVLARAPWFDWRAYREFAAISKYVTDGFLPGGLPIPALYSRVWSSCLLASDAELRGNRREYEARQRFVLEAYRHISRIRGTITFPESVNVDHWSPRSDHEEGYARHLTEIHPNTIAA